jgi:hypothetical protein
MFATVATFPGGSPLRVEFSGQGDPPVRDVLEKAGETFDTSNADIAVNGKVTRDPQTPVPDGATVTKTERVAGA